MALPASLSLTSIADSSTIVASDHRSNYAAIQTAVNGLITYLTALASPTLAGFVNADGTIPAGFTGYSVVAHGSGSYDVTFSVAYGAAPAVVAEQVTLGTTLTVSSIATTGFHVATQGSANGAFTFFAQGHP